MPRTKYRRTMTSSISSALQRTKNFLSSRNGIAQIKDGFAKAPTTTSLFPQVDPAVDGEDCNHDCDSCPVQLPKGWKIDEDEKLYGQIKGWGSHMLVATGKTDWVKDVQDEKGSVMEAVRECGVKPEHELMLSASNMPLPLENDAHPAATAPTTVLLLPAFTFIDNVTPSTVPDLIRQHINHTLTNTTPVYKSKPPVPQTGTPSQPESSSEHGPSTANGRGGENGTNGINGKHSADVAYSTNSNNGTPGNNHANGTNITNGTNGTIPTPSTMNTDPPTATDPATPGPISTALSTVQLSTPFTVRPCTHRAIILLCSQRTRDARCGQSAPLLLREFNRHLRTLGLQRDMHDERPGGVGIYFISHVGGHKFSANVMVYRRIVKTVESNGEALEEDENKDGGGEEGGMVKKSEEWGEGSQCIWLARVRPEDCEGIIKYTVLKGKVVKPERQLRGGFDREKGLTSW